MDHEHHRSVEAFGFEHAKRYDSDAELLMGDRTGQRRYLSDLLRCLPTPPRTFVDLACGTGYFTEVFFEVFPGIRGFGVDGSDAMLEQARARFAAMDRDLTLRLGLLEKLNWDSIGTTTSLVFSAFAIHHLAHEEKRALLSEIFEHLEPAGHCILFDSFRPEDPRADEIIERLTCIDIQRRVREARGTDAPLERIIGRDREVKAAEGDRESSFEAHLRWLRELGFEGVAPVFLEARMGGIIGSKPV